MWKQLKSKRSSHVSNSSKPSALSSKCTNIYTAVQNEFNKTTKLKERITANEAEINRLEQLVLNLTQRCYIRKKRELRNKIKDLRRENERYRKKCDELSFTQNVRPFLQEDEKRKQIRHMQNYYGGEHCSRSSHSSSLSSSLLHRSSSTSSRSSVLTDFLNNQNATTPHIDVENINTCSECDHKMTVELHSSRCICPNCGNSKYYIDATSASMAFGDEIELTPFSYQRGNHFRERLIYLQAKETTRVPEHVLDKVLKKIDQMGCRNTQDISLDRIRKALKELNLPQYYKQVTQIWSKITGTPPPRMTPEQEHKYMVMFNKIQAPFAKHQPGDRSNFLSYSYCLYQFSQMLGYTQFLKYFPLLKGEEKLRKQNEIFEKICQELNWDFKPCNHNNAR